MHLNVINYAFPIHVQRLYYARSKTTLHTTSFNLTVVSSIIKLPSYIERSDDGSSLGSKRILCSTVNIYLHRPHVTMLLYTIHNYLLSWGCRKQFWIGQAT